MAKEKINIIGGKRKTSVAKARIVKGSGKIVVNNLLHTNLNNIHKLLLEEPLRISKEFIKEGDFDIVIKVSGGGRESQIQAARLAIAKALLDKSKSQKLKEAFTNYDKHLLVADVRRKEAYKPDDSKARAKRQSSKR